MPPRGITAAQHTAGTTAGGLLLGQQRIACQEQARSFALWFAPRFLLSPGQTYRLVVLPLSRQVVAVYAPTANQPLWPAGQRDGRWWALALSGLLALRFFWRAITPGRNVDSG